MLTYGLLNCIFKDDKYGDGNAKENIIWNYYNATTQYERLIKKEKKYYLTIYNGLSNNHCIFMPASRGKTKEKVIFLLNLQRKEEKKNVIQAENIREKRNVHKNIYIYNFFFIKKKNISSSRHHSLWSD